MESTTTPNLETDDRSRKRALWEAFAFSVPAKGSVKVSNYSYGEEHVADHTYTVTVSGGVPSSCDCPAFEHHDGSCKHMVAVANREAVLLAASRAGEEPIGEGCWCDGDPVPCWSCYRDGRRDMPDDIEG